MTYEQVKVAVVSLAVLGVLSLIGMSLPDPWGLDDQTGSVVVVGALSAIAGLITPKT